MHKVPLREFCRNAITEALLPRTMKQLQVGKSVDFGNLALEGRSLYCGDQKVDVTSLTELRFRRKGENCFTLDFESQGTIVLSCDMREVHNLCVLMAILSKQGVAVREPKIRRSHYGKVNLPKYDPDYEE